MATALIETRFAGTGLGAIRDKVLAGRRLSFEDGVALFKSHDLLAIGHLANIVRERKHGDAAYFVWNTHINHTNVCVATCDFCAFAAKKGEPRAYTMGLPEVFANVKGLPAAVREVHIVGGLHPDLPWSYFIDMMKGIKEARPDIHIKAFTAVEIFFFHRLYRMTVAQVLKELKDAGLDSLPGGGAEIFNKETRDKIIQGKADAVNPQGIGTKAAAHYHALIPQGEQATYRLRLTNRPPTEGMLGEEFDRIFAARTQEADEFYAARAPQSLSKDGCNIQRQAFAGLLWSKQFYHYDVRTWLRGDPAGPV